MKEGETIVTLLTEDVMKEIKERDDPILQFELSRYQTQERSALLLADSNIV